MSNFEDNPFGEPIIADPFAGKRIFTSIFAFILKIVHWQIRQFSEWLKIHKPIKIH